MSYVLAWRELFCRLLSNSSGSSNSCVSYYRVSSGAVNDNLFYCNFLYYYRVAINSLCVLVATANHGYAEKNSE